MIKHKIVVVLGMHRSGTSAITGGLLAMGVELGENLMPAVNKINAKGFFEDLDLNNLNVEMLHAINSDWHHLTPLTLRDIDILLEAGFLQRAADILKSKAHHKHVFGFKDPRVTKLLRFWKRVFEYCQFDVKYIVAIRHPLSVARSLYDRDRFDFQFSYLLWLEYNLEALSGTFNECSVIVDYDRLMQDPDYEMRRIANKLGLNINTLQLQNYITDFIDRNLQSTIFNIEDLLNDTSCPKLVGTVYPILLGLASDNQKVTGNIEEKISDWLTDFSQYNLHGLLSMADRLSSTIISSKRESATHIAKLDTIINEIYSSLTWRLTRPLRYIMRLKQRLLKTDHNN